MREIPLSGEAVALVDDSDYPAVILAGPWHRRPHGNTTYAQRRIRLPDGRWSTQQLHQFILGTTGIDHANRNGLDNRRSNLRPANQSHNMANIDIAPTNTTGFKGVTYRSRTGRFIAQIRVNRKQLHIGVFLTAEDAARAYDAVASQAWGEFARLNFPQEKSA